MVPDIIANNAAGLEDELAWFYRVIDTRLKLHFGHECKHADIFDIAPPAVPTGSTYGSFVRHYEMTAAERMVLLLALTPHIRPQLLDAFLTLNADNQRTFSEFGGRNGHSNCSFLPTGETALFILAGDNLERRLALSYLFDADHYFSRHQILTLETTNSYDPYYSGFLTLSRELFDLLTSGQVRRPIFGMSFPAKHLETRLAWEDLILEPFTMSQVLEIKAWMEYGDQLLRDPQLGKKLRPGFRSLFHGPPGTGKTLTATLLGKITKRDVYRIDLSMVVSKWIGETEKNLEKIFQKAEHKDWILFFDEADALFGKRTDINNAHDRFANQEVSYLLQRVEDYAGVVILATNLKTNLDEAFTRRFQSVVYFPIPQESERLRLWQNGFSDQVPLTGDIELHDVACKYEISGGAIMNIVRYTTLMAMSKDEKHVSREIFQDGIKKEFQKEGKTL